MAKKKRSSPKGDSAGDTGGGPSAVATTQTDNGAKSQKSVHWKDQKPLPSAAIEKEPNDTTNPMASGNSSRTYIGVALLSFVCGIMLPVVQKRWTGRFVDVLPGDQRTEMVSPQLAKLKSILNRKEFTRDSADNASDHGSDGRQRRLEEESSPGEVTACSEENLSQFLHEWPATGIHMACVSQGDDDALGNLHVRFFRGAINYDDTPVGLKPRTSGREVEWPQLRELLEDKLELPESGAGQQPWAIFTPNGERIVGANDEDDDIHDEPDEEFVIRTILHSNMILIMEGGAWVWPGVRVGFIRRNVNLYSVMPGPPGTSYSGNSNRTVNIETLSLKPLVLSIQNFIADDECDVIQEVAAPSMEYSEVTKMDHDKGKPSSDWRTSQSTFVKGSRSKVLRDLELRTASLTRIPLEHQEDVQVLRYGVTEHYSAHHDYFDPRMYKSDRTTMRLIDGGRRNRLATVFWYLSDVEEGGETVFPRWNGAPQPTDFKDCTKGLKVKPERGKVIIFYSLDARGQQDELSLHGACAVKKGIKWAANKWVWNAPMHFISSHY